MTKQEVIDNLKNLASELGPSEYLTEKEIRKVPKLRFYITRHFRHLNDALKEANLPSSHLASSMSISDENLLGYLKDLQKELKHDPKVWDIEHDEKIYKKYFDKKISWGIYKTRFGGLKSAKKIIGSGTTESKFKKKYGNNKHIDYNNVSTFQSKNRFWGEAAELHVTAELLYRGFQAANIPVDEGLDILAFKNNKTFYFQVKHKNLDSNEPIRITKSSFEAKGGGDVYYIFVLLSDNKREFLIIPYHIIKDWIRGGLAEEKDKDYLIYIKKENEQFSLKGIVLDKHLGKWEDIK